MYQRLGTVVKGEDMHLRYVKRTYTKFNVWVSHYKFIFGLDVI